MSSALPATFANKIDSGSSVLSDTCKTTPDNQKFSDLKTMLIDLISYNICDFANGKSFALSGNGGASSGGGKTPVTGSFMIRSCNAHKLNSNSFSISISGIGWNWVSESKSVAGARFILNDNVKFMVDMSIDATIDLLYDKRNHIATGYFVPLAPVDVSFQVMGDIDIETKDLWSSIVGTFATIIGQSPEKQAAGTAKKTGTRQFKAQLDNGLTLVIDMCTGRSYTIMGSFPKGKIPESGSPEPGINFQANSIAELHKNSMIIAGSYSANKPLIAYIEIRDGGAVDAQWLYNSDAELIADAYVNEKAMPPTAAVEKQIVKPGMPAMLTVSSGVNKPVVLVLRPEQNDPGSITLLYRIYYEGDRTRPLTECNQ